MLGNASMSLHRPRWRPVIIGCRLCTLVNTPKTAVSVGHPLATDYYMTVSVGSFAMPNPATSATPTTALLSIYAVATPSGPGRSYFSITASPASQSIGAGSSASSTLSLAAGAGFSGTVTLAVTLVVRPGVPAPLPHLRSVRFQVRQRSLFQP